MKPLILLALTLALSVVVSAAGCGLRPGMKPLSSTLYIEPGEQFVLGGNNPNPWSAAAYNKGDVPVTIYRRTGVAMDEVATVAPGDTAAADFAGGQAAVLVNASDRQARLRVDGTTANLGMRYEPGDDTR